MRPLINMGDNHSFNEVFFEDVRVPARQRVGEENRGWYHLAVALDFERSGIGAYAGGRRTIERLVRIAKEHPDLWERRPSVRHELADRMIEVNVGTFPRPTALPPCRRRAWCPTTRRARASSSAGELGQRVALTGMHVLGLTGQLRGQSSRTGVDQAQSYLQAVSGTIAAGTSEIQRNIMATRGLGLPRG